MNTPRAIETRYKGYRFRSRLEARWAVFFRALDIPWEYEPEGFALATGRYLPDFRLWGHLYAEVKPPVESEVAALNAAGATFALETGKSLVLLVGPPAIKWYPVVRRDSDSDNVSWDSIDLGSSALKERPWYAYRALPPEEPPEAIHVQRLGVEAALGARFEHGETPG